MIIPRSIIIIGAGLSGMATGCYGQMNTYRTKIFETQNKPGGVCVSWKRNGYTFDYAVHNVFGLSPKSANYKTWQEVGALRGLTAHDFTEFVQIEDANGKKFTVYADLAKLGKHLKELSPADTQLIEEFIKTARKFANYDLFAALSGGIFSKIKMIPLLPYIRKFVKITLQEYANKFTDPFLRKAFATIQYDIPDVPMLIPLIFLATLNGKDGGWPIGGSMALARNMEKRYLELGGEIHYNSKVTKILTANNQAVGIKLADGTEQYAEIIISAADGYSTIFDLLNGKYSNEKINTYYKSIPPTQLFGLEIWYGISRQTKEMPHAMVLFLNEPLEVEGKLRDRLNIELMGFDPTLAPPSKSVIKVIFESNYNYWKELSTDTEEYNNEKKRLTHLVAQKLEERFPGFTNQIEATDVVTPISAEHWTSAYHGYQAWGAPKEYAKEINKNGLSKTLPELNNFYMVGQWSIAQVGLTTAVITGRNLIRDLCKKDRKRFVASTKSQ
jgi:phytoene dehydrogenase-like protein